MISDAGRARREQARATYEETLTAELDEVAEEDPEAAAAIGALRAAP